MTDKLEALKALADEIATGYRQKWGCEDGINDDSISVGTYNDDGDICPFIEVSISDWSGNDDDNEKLAKFIALANPPVVSELLSALEEKGQEVNQLKSDYQKLAQEHRFLANESARKGVRNAELEQRLQQLSKEGKELFAEISSECVVDNDNFVGYLVKDECMGNLERLLTGSLSLPIKLTLPTTRYWHGPLSTYEKSDVIACINAAAKSSNVIIKVEGE